MPSNFINTLILRTPFYYGWIIMGSIFIVSFFGVVFTNPSLSVLIGPITEEFGWSKTLFSGAIATSTFISAPAGIIVGKMIDRYGARVMLALGTIGTGASLIFLANIQNVFMFYAGILVGRTLVATIPTLGGSVAIVNWFISRRKTAMALLMLASYLGIALLPIIYVSIFDSANWRTALWVIGTLTIFSATAPWLFIIAKRPEDVGLRPDGVKDSNTDQFSPRMNIVEVNWETSQAVRTRSFWFITLSTMAVMLSMGSQLHRLPFFLEKGLDAETAGLWAIALAVGMSSGGFVVALLGKWIPDRILLSVTLLLGAVLLFLLPITAGTNYVILHGCGDGLIVGSTMTLMPTMFGNYFGREAGGTIRGIAHVPMMTANAIGPIIPSIFYDFAGNNYVPAFQVIGICLLIGSVLAYFARVPVKSPQNPNKQA